MTSQSVDLYIGGMTCTSCATRIENKLNRLPGVEATVNYAIDTATLSLSGETSVAEAIAAIEGTGYTAELPHEQDSEPVAAGPDSELERLRQRLVISAVLAAPVVLLSMIPLLQFENWQWLALALASPVAVWGAWPFHRAAWLNARHGAATMDTLISVGVLAAFGWSLYALFFGMAGQAGMTMTMDGVFSQRGGSADIYLEVAAAVTVFILAGRYFEVRAKQRSGAALAALLARGVTEVTVRIDGGEQRIAISALAVGDEFIVRPGETVAADGRVLEGSSAIDQSMITGESVPVEVGIEDRVIGGTVNTGGHLVVVASRVGADTELAQMGRLVTQAQTGKADVQRLADRISGVFVPVVIGLALLTLAGWLLITGDAELAFTAAVATLIIACPCALGLATPTALLVGTGRGAQLGILIKGPQILESTRRVDTIVLDKTGTVTSGRMSLAELVVVDGVDEALLLSRAGALENASEHPIGMAIARAALAAGAALPPVEAATAQAGLGITGIVDGHVVAVGRADWLRDTLALTFPPALAAAVSRLTAGGLTSVGVAWDGQVRGVIAVADTVRPTSAEAIRNLIAMGLTPILLTGDNDAVARSVAAMVGVTEVHSEVLPKEKAALIARLQASGRVVAMVGDGVNDSIALATADIGIAMGTGADVAKEASDLTVIRGDLMAVVDALRLARRTLGTIKGNLFWAFAYNVAAIPLAALGFLSPLVAGAAMALSSVFVVSNSLRLRSFRPLTDSE